MGKCKYCKNEEVTDIVVIFDRSGSMMNIQSEMIGAYNRFIKEQCEVPGKARVTLIAFDDKIETIFDKVDLDSVREIGYADVEPRGMTALNDAIGTSISKIDNDRVVLLIQTDGIENYSREYTTDKIKDLISEKKKIGWDVSFIGADMDAFAQGGANYGIDIGKCFSFDKTQQGVDMFRTYVSTTATTYRTNSSTNDEK